MSGPSNHINAGSWAFVISSLGQPGIRFRSISNQSLNRLRHELVDPSLCKVARTNSVKCRLLWSKNRARVRACVWSGNDWITACLELNPIEAPSGDVGVPQKCWHSRKGLDCSVCRAPTGRYLIIELEVARLYQFRQRFNERFRRCVVVAVCEK